MSSRRESIHFGKRTEPDVMADASSAHMEPQREGPTSAIRQRVEEMRKEEKDQEIEMLRQEIQRLRKKVARSKSQTFSTTSPIPTATMSKKIIKRRLDEEGISLQDFLRLKTPEFRRERGEDPQEFLEEIEKIVKRLPCSDARAIELVGMVMKGNAWDWYHRNIEDQVYSSSPPTWDTFRQAVMDEFFTPIE